MKGTGSLVNLAARGERIRRQAEREARREELSRTDPDLAQLVEVAVPLVDRLIRRGKGEEALEALGLRARWIRSMQEQGHEDGDLRTDSEYWGIGLRVKIPKVSPRHRDALYATQQVMEVVTDHIRDLGSFLAQAARDAPGYRNLKREQIELHITAKRFTAMLEAVDRGQGGGA